MTPVEVLAQAASEGVFPAAAYAVGDRHRVEVGFVGCTEGSLFDLASLTKVVATTPIVFSLVRSGQVGLDDPVSRYLAEWSGRDVTVRYLLNHTSGLAPYDFGLAGAGLGRNATLRGVLAQEVRPSGDVCYSCLGFVTLCALAEAVTGKGFAELFDQEVAGPLGMASTRFGPVEGALPTPAGTGVAHDPLARALGGVSGNAGLFAPLGDLVRYARAWLPGGMFGDATEWTLASAGTRALGWDTKSAEGSSAGDRMGPRSFGHLGYTGTALWIDPDARVFEVLLTNAVVYSEEKVALRDFRPGFFDGATSSFLRLGETR